MAQIKLTRSKYALVDDRDLELVNQRTWHYSRLGYAMSNSKDKLSMHRFIMGIPKGGIDHINRDGLDNRRVNLRLCNQSQNTMNSPKRTTNKSGFKGVSWDKRSKKWVVTLTKNYKHLWGGLFDDKLKAAKRYNEFAKFHFGEFAYLNKL